MRKTIPQNLLERCEPIQKLDPTVDVDMGVLIVYIVDLYSNYSDCALQHDKLIKVITETPKQEQ